jgi:nucleoside-diphosphate-sugar epimerase
MKTVIVGRTSNLSAGLSATLPESVLLSARELTSVDVKSVLPREPFVLVMNHFQPASRLGDVSSPNAYVQLALTTTARLLEGIADCDCRKILYTSSAAVYGDNVACKEDDVPRAANLHAALKISNEHLVRDVCANRGLDCTVVRLFNLYGGQDKFSIVAKLVAAVRSKTPLVLANEGNAIRDFVHLDDVLACYRTLLEHRDLPTVNVATGVGTSVRSIVDAVRLRGHRLDTTSVRSNEIRVSTADVSRLSEVVEVEGFVKVIDHVLSELA